MPGYADVEDPVALLNRAPSTPRGSRVEDSIRQAGFEVQAVNWVWEKVVGESLVDSIIKPITGDFEKIAEQAGQWRNIKDALQALRNNLNAGLGELQPAWSGEASDKFRDLIGTTWTLGIEADAQAANLIGFALNKVADGSQRACEQILRLIKMLVDKLIEAAAMLPIPVVGWGRAVKLVYDGIQLYNAIMQLIEGIKSIIYGAQQVIQGIQQVGTALSKIKDINNLNDALNVANEAGEGVASVKRGSDAVRGGLSDVAQGTTAAANATASAHDNARGLHDERAAARDHDGTSASGTGASTGTGRPTGTPGDRDQSGGIRDQNGDPRANGRPTADRPDCGDPIDIATGQVMVTHVDLELPGVLPLIIERAHISSCQVGRWFGRSWASTVDQRVEVDAQGVCFAAADGMLLQYAVPGNGSTVLPDEGPRWPLARTADGGYTITKPEHGQVLHFAPAPAATLPITAISDRNGHRIDFDYDQTGAIAGIRHDGGYRLGVDTSDGRITALRLVDADVVVTRYRYDEAGRLTDVINSSGAALRFEYDRDGRISRWEDRNGLWYRYHYDERGRCVRAEGSGGFLNYTFDYDPANLITVATNSLGQSTTFHLNEAHQVVRETNPLGHTSGSEWDRYNRLLARTDALGRTTRYTYDDAGNLTGITRADGSTARAVYNELGLAVLITDPDGAVWGREYDERGNPVAVTDPLGATTRYGYDERGHLTVVSDALGHTRRVETNAAGLPIAVTDPLGAVTRYRRDPFGRVTDMIDPVGGVTRFGWTVEGRLAWRTQPDGATERWRYDGEGNIVEFVDPLGQVTRSEIVHFDLPGAEIGPDGARLRFGYDTELRLTAVTNPQGLEWRYEYDAAGSLVRETDFNGHTLSYVHDAAGQLIERTNGAGETTRYTRDLLGNVVEQRSGETITTFRHDSRGRIVGAANSAAELVFERDPLGRVVAETCNGRTVTSSYDAVGRRLRRRTPSGADSRWEYDANGNPLVLHAAGQTVRFEYDTAGREVERQLGSGAVLAQTWDDNHQLRTQAITGAGRQPRLLQRRAYTYRPDGQITAIVDQLSGPRTFDLDPAGRPIRVQGQGWAEAYTYDVAGNITRATWPTGAPESDAQGEREYRGTLITRAGGVRYQHDGQGRVVLRQKQRPSAKPANWHYVWDADDRMVGVTTPDGQRWRYLYDPLGRRIAKQRLDEAGSAVVEQTDFVWDGTVLAEQHERTLVTVWDWQPGGFRPIGQTEREPLRDAPQEWIDKQFYAIVTDVVGTPTELLDPAGNVAWHAHHTLWGALLSGTPGTADTPLRFPGQYYDVETGLNYNYHRYYDPAVSRYHASDPLGLEGGLNPHAYVLNPLGWFDPLGLKCRNAALNQAKQDLGIPRAQHPEAVNRVPMTDRNGRTVMGENGRPIMTREYVYKRPDGSTVIIQDHSAGHQFGEGGVGDQPPHFNVRPPENTRTGHVPGTQDHYPFDRR